MRKKKNEFTGCSFESLEDLNRQVAQWLATVNIRTMAKAGLVADKTLEPETSQEKSFTDRTELY